jgi:hypothetical protein
MKRAFFVTIAALGLAACTLPDIEPSALAPASDSQAAASQDQPPASPYNAGQSPDNTGDYSHYF